MKAEPALPTVSAADVAGIGTSSVEAYTCDPKLARHAAVKVPLDVVARPHGMAQLVHQVTGDVLGQCVNKAVAKGTRDFLA